MKLRNAAPLEQVDAVREAPTRSLRYRPMFAYAYDPTKALLREGEVLPFVYKITILPGVNGVMRDNRGRWELTHLDKKLGEAGVRRIPWTMTPTGESYMVDDGTEDRGPSGYYAMWETPYAGSEHIEVNMVAFVEWVKWLASDDGWEHMSPPSPHTVAVLLKDEQDALRDARNRAFKAPGEVFRVEAGEQRVKAVEVYLRKNKGAPKPRRKSAPKLTPRSQE